MKVLEEVAKTSIQLLLEEPFFSHILASLNKEVVGSDHRMKSVGIKIVNNQHVLVINSSFWQEKLTNTAHRYGWLKHEILHIILMHTIADLQGKNSILCYIAMDLVINQYIDEDKLTESSFTIEQFPELHLLKHQTWEYYYWELFKLPEEVVSQLTDHNDSVDSHELWKDHSEMTSVEKELQKAFIKQLIGNAKEKTTNNDWGAIDKHLKEYLEGLLISKPPTINWRKMVRLFSSNSQKTKIQNSIKRVSKRYGTVPGLRIKRTNKLLIAIDTSGSINKNELEEFFTEIFHLWRTGVEILITECDVTIKRIYVYKGILPKFVLGRGGTDFNAPIQQAKDEIKPDGIIYFTDGFGLPPTVTTSIPILWVISSDGISINDESLAQFPGRRIKIGT